MDETTVRGLTSSEAAERLRAGQGNVARPSTGRTYPEIVRENVFTFINVILFGIGLVLVAMGQFGDALVTAGLVIVNVLVGVYQEVRAKATLDRIALLARPGAAVIRDGEERVLPPEEVVLGDLLVVRPGDQVVVDGPVVDGHIEADESLLTGESDLVPKGPGDPLYSGSYCVSGSASYRAEVVGEGSLASRITGQARAYRRLRTPLQSDVYYIVRVLAVAVSALGVLLGLSFVVGEVPLVESVRVGAVIVALVPQGLLMMITVAYAMAAYRVAGRGALIQRSNAVESSSHVNLLCVDKTGTLTTNRIVLDAIEPAGGDEAIAGERLRRLLGDVVASASGGTRTSEAIARACPGDARPVAEEVTFSSERKWSGVRLEGGHGEGAYVLGAPEVLLPHLDGADAVERAVAERAGRGLRVVLFAGAPAGAPLRDAEGRPRLPERLEPLALLTFREELRFDADDTIKRFRTLGVQVKVISGDSARTVGALARRVGFPEGTRTMSGPELEALPEDEFARAAREVTVFGRTTPQQKEGLVAFYRRSGRYVAMIGDGVNDVPSLKRAHVAVAMESGSAAARGVADIVLLRDSFDALPAALREGQRVIRGMEDVVRLLLTRTLWVLLLIVATRIVGLPFPVTPKHNSVLALLTVGVPIVAIAAWARPGRPGGPVLLATGRFVYPAAFLTAALALGVYLGYYQATGDLSVARTALTTAGVLAGLLLILFVEPPARAWVGGDELSGDLRPTLLALAMLAAYVLILAVPAVRGFFELEPLPLGDLGLIATATAIWALALRAVWRTRLLERLLRRPTRTEDGA